jgi:hypothetical protein
MRNVTVFKPQLWSRKSGQQIYVLAVMGRISQQIVVVYGPIRFLSDQGREVASIASGGAVVKVQ